MRFLVKVNVRRCGSIGIFEEKETIVDVLVGCENPEKEARNLAIDHFCHHNYETRRVIRCLKLH